MWIHKFYMSTEYNGTYVDVFYTRNTQRKISHEKYSFGLWSFASVLLLLLLLLRIHIGSCGRDYYVWQSPCSVAACSDAIRLMRHRIERIECYILRTIVYIEAVVLARKLPARVQWAKSRNATRAATASAMTAVGVPKSVFRFDWMDLIVFHFSVCLRFFLCKK